MKPDHSEEVSAKNHLQPKKALGEKGPHMEEEGAEEREVPSESDPDALQTEERKGGFGRRLKLSSTSRHSHIHCKDHWWIIHGSRRITLDLNHFGFCGRGGQERGRGEEGAGNAREGDMTPVQDQPQGR